MWYAFQITITGYVAFIYLTQISNEKDVLHAIVLGGIVAFYATLILSGTLNTLGKLIRSFRSMLLCCNLSALRRHKQPDKLIHVDRSGSPRPPRLISKV